MPASTDRNNSFAVLRLLLAGAVIVGHAPEIIDGSRAREPLTRLFGSLSLGELAVDGFFVLSGFLLALSWLGKPALGRYGVRRVLRILPGFAVASAVSVLIVGAIGAPDASRYFSAVDWVECAKRVLTLAPPLTPPTFVGTHYPSVNVPMWTIRSEFICYTSIPLLGVAGLLKRPKWMLAVVAVSLLASAATLLHAGHSSGVAEGGLWTQLRRLARLWPFFCCGAALACWRGRLPRSRWTAIAAASFVLAAMLLLRNRAEPVLAIPFAYLLIDTGLNRLRFAKAWFRAFDASYGTYLYAWPIQKLLVWAFPGIGPIVNASATLLLAFVAGAISWVVVERPAIRASERVA